MLIDLFYIFFLDEDQYIIFPKSFMFLDLETLRRIHLYEYIMLEM